MLNARTVHPSDLTAAETAKVIQSFMDQIIDELARGKAMNKILRA